MNQRMTEADRAAANSTALATRGNGAVAVPSTQASNPFLDAARQMSGNRIVGSLLTFSKGDFIAGEKKEEVELGTELIANIDEAMWGWQKWEGKKPVEQAMIRVAEGRSPKRSDLDAQDKSTWELDDRGDARDPWQETYYVIFKMPGENDLYTFTTSSFGGKKALSMLFEAYGKGMRQRPDEFPIVKLAVHAYDHEKYGRTKEPRFNVVGWTDKAEFLEALGVEANTAASGDDEEIPF